MPQSCDLQTKIFMYYSNSTPFYGFCINPHLHSTINYQMQCLKSGQTKTGANCMGVASRRVASLQAKWQCAQLHHCSMPGEISSQGIHMIWLYIRRWIRILIKMFISMKIDLTNDSLKLLLTTKQNIDIAS